MTTFPTLPAKKRIALVAHDNAKRDMLEWAVHNRETLANYNLCGTGTTGRLVAEKTGLPIDLYKSGPLGGDQQIGSKISEFEIDLLIFFWDPLTTQPHDPDVKALLRLSVLYNIPTACNRSTADFLITSPLMTEEFERVVPDLVEPS